MSRPIREKGEPFDAFVARLEAWSLSDEGIAHDREIIATKERDIAAERSRQQREIVDRAGIPFRLAEMFAKGAPRMTEAIAALDHMPTVLVIAGKSGSGKTVAAAWWLWEYVHSPITPARWPRFVPAGDLPRIDERELMTLRSCPRLVIDDLGMEYADDKGFFSTVLDRLMDWRYANLKPTVITTNLRAESFKIRYQNRIADRIREDGAFVEISNASLRVAAP